MMHLSLIRNSIKEAVDTLPIGIAFFRANGIPILCNTKMYELTHILIGKDMQLLAELHKGQQSPSLQVQRFVSQDECLYLFPDQTIWKFEETTIHTEEGKMFTQVNAFDYTELYQRETELAQRNEELREMIDQVQRITANVAEITRQQEILNAKIRLHNKMGSCMLGIKEYLMQKENRDQKQILIDMWRRNLAALQEEVGAEDGPDALQMVIDVAANLGVQIQIEGTLPQKAELRKLLIAGLRECVTNTKKHAEGESLTMKLEYGEHMLVVSYTNNGRQPEREIIEGGGLTSLRQSVNEAGGMMEIQSVPVFILTMKIPME